MWAVHLPARSVPEDPQSIFYLSETYRGRSKRGASGSLAESKRAVRCSCTYVLRAFDTTGYAKKKRTIRSEHDFPDLAGPTLYAHLYEQWGWSKERVDSSSILTVWLFLLRYAEHQQALTDQLERYKHGHH